MRIIWKSKSNIYIALTILLQLLSVTLASVGFLDQSVLWVNLLLVGGGLVFLEPVQSLGLYWMSLPFMVVLPEGALNNMQMWRPLAVVLFASVLVRVWWPDRKQSLSVWLRSFVSSKLSRWDLWFLVLLSLSVISLLSARFAGHGFKQIIFVVNAYLVYVSALMALKTETNLKSVKNFLLGSLLVTVLLGFVQFSMSLFSQPYYFWQLWATIISSVYYGNPLAEVLSYSNSWFSGDGAGGSIRMFGILQDTHAFGMISVYALFLWLSSARVEGLNSLKEFLGKQTLAFWFVMVLLCFAIIASGTRGVWVAMLVPIMAMVLIVMRYKAKLLSALAATSFFTVIILFILSPYITLGLNTIRTYNTSDGFLDRAASIYDLEESSNVGRIEIWMQSLSYAASHPLGTGYGNFISSLSGGETVSSYEDLSAQKDERYNLPQKFITAHSLYLHLLVELGVLGLLLFVIAWFSFGINIFRKLIANEWNLDAHNLLLFNTALALLWLLAYGLFDVTILNERVLIYTMSLVAIVSFLLKTKTSNKT